jgi:hypothetical protein
MRNNIKIRLNKQKIKQFPDQMISNLLKSMFLDIINIGKFSEDSYTQLSEPESTLFDDIITASKVDGQMYKHDKYYSKIVNDDINRFNIIKGEILIGNDSKELLKELRILILRLLKYDVLDKRVFNELMLDILLLL